jgi:hypothetical protein
MAARTIYGPDGKPISSKKEKEKEKEKESERPARVEPGTPQFRAMQKQLHLSENQLRGAIRRSLRVAVKGGLKGKKSSLDSVHRAQEQASRDEAKRLKAEKKSRRLEATR